jgi:hypothetical protein
MSDSLAEFLDDLNHHIERELAKVPAPLANSLLHGDSPLSTVEMLRFLAKAEKAAVSFVNPGAKAPPNRDGGDKGALAT